MEVKILISRLRTKTIGFDFDMYAWHLLCEMNDLELHQLGDIPQEKMLADFTYAAAVSYLTHRRKKVKFTKDELGDWLDKMNRKDSELLALEILNSKVFGKTVSEHAAEAVKKK